MKPICVPCQRFYRPKKNGFSFVEGMPINNAKPGKANADKWRPYKLWSGDLWECPDCGHQIISGTGHTPIAIQHEQGFDELVKGYNATFQVNDC